MHLQSGDVFYLLSGTESAGSPPRRVAPSIPLNRKANESDFVERNNFPGPTYPAAERSYISSQEAGNNYQENTIPCAKSLDNKLTHSVGLPNLRTGTDISHCIIIPYQLNIVSSRQIIKMKLRSFNQIHFLLLNLFVLLILLIEYGLLFDY